MGAGGGGWGAQVNVRISVEGVSRRRTMRAVWIRVDVVVRVRRR